MKQANRLPGLRGGRRRCIVAAQPVQGERCSGMDPVAALDHAAFVDDLDEGHT